MRGRISKEITMVFRYEVKIGEQWVPTSNGIVLADGRLGYMTACGRSGVAKAPFWRQTEESTRQPEFRQVCFDALTQEEKECAVARLGGLPKF